MKIKINLAAILVGATLFALPAICFEYDEAIQGEISNHGNRGTALLFNLDVGQNVIQGSTRIGAGADFDAFHFRVPPGAVLDLSSIVYEYEITDISGEMHAFGGLITIGMVNPPGPALFATGFFEDDGNFGDATFYIYNDGMFSSKVVRPSPITLPFFQIIDGTINLDFPAQPLGQGIYWFSPGASWVGGFGPNDSATWNYKLTITVTPAP